MMWLQGAYFYDAVSKALANSFSKNKKYNYVDKPFDLNQNKQIDKEKLNEKVTNQNNFWATFKERQLEGREST